LTCLRIPARLAAGKFCHGVPWPDGGFSDNRSRLSERQIALILRQGDEGEVSPGSPGGDTAAAKIAGCDPIADIKLVHVDGLDLWRVPTIRA
jgi:hypothetical protein